METPAAFASLELPGHPALQVRAGQTVLEALRGARVDLHQPAIAIVNGQSADLSYQLEAGDIVRLVPQIAGG